MIKFKNLVLALFVLLLSACTTATIVTTPKELPAVYVDKNETHEVKRSVKISLFRFDNYTDTPRAGKRAANIFEGILRAKEYKVTSHIKEKAPVSLQEAQRVAKVDGSKYFMFGGVSEWRYKTGIDGEPAVSLQCTLYKVKNLKVRWSATGSDSDWGNASIGTTAHELLLDMIDE